MKGDLTRATFRPERHFSSVRQQQGRVLLDADWNEQADIEAYRRHVTAGDLIGPAGGPLHAAAFGYVDAAPLTQAQRTELQGRGVVFPLSGDVLLGPGRYYVDGVLCENEQIVSYLHQPDGAGLSALPAGRHLLYLHVWERHVTWLDDPLLREVALNGPDTATRARVVWQIGALPVAAGTACLAAVPAYDQLVLPPTGTLRARAAAGNTNQGPCVVSDDAGYRRLENQLYRVEVHDGGAVGVATFKWSRDNGAVVTSVKSIAGADVVVGEVGRDALLSFAPGQTVELVDDALELRGVPGTMYEIDEVDVSTGTVRLTQSPGYAVNAALHPKLRRWDGGEAVKVTTGGWIALEQDGVEIRFAAGTYRAGDWWLVPARTTTGDVEWPKDGANQPAERLPAGTQHHYARLGLVDIAGNGSVSGFLDCRSLFPPVTELTTFEYLGGDGQEVMPNFLQPGNSTNLALPLRVGVANGRWPVQGARVVFEVLDGGGQVQGTNPNTAFGAQMASFTTAEGVAEALWRLPSTGAPHRVRATLRDAADQRVGLPIIFGANLSQATQVAYDPRNVCGSGNVPQVNTVQAALDRQTQLCRLFYAGGDGQEAMPGQPLAQPLRVSVANACGPVAGATVTFAADAGGHLGAAIPVAGGAPATLTATTDANGFAQVFWVPANDGTRPSQQCTATLSAAPNSLPLGSPVSVRFTGGLSIAAQVGYTPSSNCNLPQSINNVQAALDQLCAGLGAPPQRIVVQNVTVGATNLRPDVLIPGPTLGLSGIDVVCDQPLDALAGQTWACEVEVLMMDNRYDIWSVRAPLRLQGMVSVSGSTLQWRAHSFLQTFLNQFTNVFFPTQAHLTVRGNFVWGSSPPNAYLDADLFTARVNNLLAAQFPTGDGIRGGNLEMWFWLGTPYVFTFGDIAASGTTVGTVSVTEPAPEGGLTLRLASSDPAVAALPETVFIPEGETRVTFDAKVKPPKSGPLDVQISSTLVEAGDRPIPQLSVTHDVRLQKRRR
ncbi:DUF6519 domain-containing protein [Longimicrobium sp.]|uniref:DUF6519 domain-containing protein n=1 Tax=Longimicrobium sp. TaxID=2029185 RepID=UPI002BF6230D|nr:DUF6519 domain-containing protein [Longimicrobium sp.]HSU13667.1 DUF6519 domain-containing protein [Longimicrobium sp.]